MTPKQQRFVEEFLVDLNATQAAIRAGYSEKTAQEQSSRLLSNVMVQEAIRKAQDERSKRMEISADRVLQDLMRIGLSDVRKLFGEDGHLKLPSELDEDTAAAIASVEVVTRPVAGSPDRNEIEHIHKIRFWDKNSALDKLMKHLGAYAAEKLDHTSRDGEPKYLSLADMYADMERAKLKVLRESEAAVN